MLSVLLSWISGGGLNGIAREIARVRIERERAQTAVAKLESDVILEQLQARQAVLIAEQGNWQTRWIRPALAFPAIVFWWKLLIWDTVLGLGTTPDPGEWVMWFAVTVPNVYFLMRPVEKLIGRRVPPRTS